MIHYFSFFLATFFILYKVFGNYYALDHPDKRKQHEGEVSQIGGLIIGPLLLLIAWWLNLAPQWYLVSGLIAILLGVIDDNHYVPWQIKFTVQLALAIYIATIFWGRFDSIVFYNLSFSISQIQLVAVFLIWFIGIFNAVNLLDGLDGLAGGFMLLLCFGIGLSGSGPIVELNIIFSIGLLVFLVFNQRPAKLFMGDAGSLFLGFHTAVIPLLFLEITPSIKMLNMTPFVLLASYLIADTTRVFITRLANKKSPMTADTIHFHHLILQQSGSYLSSIGTIFFLSSISVIGSILSFHFELSSNFMLIHSAVLLFFILTPPIETYVPTIIKAVGPVYKWQKNQREKLPFLPRTIFMIVLFCGLIISISYQQDLMFMNSRQNFLSVLFLLIFILYFRRDYMGKYVIQLALVLFFGELCWNVEFGIVPKLCTTFLILSYIVFTLEKRAGTNIIMFSALDLLMIFLTLGGLILSFFNLSSSIWFFLIMFSIWFASSFILFRTMYAEN